MGNFVVVGLALISNMFSSKGLGKASIIVGFILPLYNVLTIVALTVSATRSQPIDSRGNIN